MKTIAQQLNWDFKANGNLEIKNNNGNIIYYENSYEFWVKRECNSQGKEIYSETSNGDWDRSQYDSEGNQIYYEHSHGHIIDNRPYSCENKVIE